MLKLASAIQNLGIKTMWFLWFLCFSVGFAEQTAFDFVDFTTSSWRYSPVVNISKFFLASADQLVTMSPTDGIAARRGQSASFHPVSNELFLFGGRRLIVIDVSNSTSLAYSFQGSTRSSEFNELCFRFCLIVQIASSGNTDCPYDCYGLGDCDTTSEHPVCLCNDGFFGDFCNMGLTKVCGCCHSRFSLNFQSITTNF